MMMMENEAFKAPAKDISVGKKPMFSGLQGAARALTRPRLVRADREPGERRPGPQARPRLSASEKRRLGCRAHLGVAPRPKPFASAAMTVHEIVSDVWVDDGPLRRRIGQSACVSEEVRAAEDVKSAVPGHKSAVPGHLPSPWAVRAAVQVR